MKTTTILAVQRAIVILRHLSEASSGVGVRELAQRLGYSPSVVQKILNTLKVYEFVRKDEAAGTYHLGSGALALGLAALSKLELRAVARPHMETLSKASGETVFLGVLDRLRTIYVDKVTGTGEMWIDAPLGAERPLNCTAIGKVLLASLPEKEWKALAAQGAFVRCTPRALVAVEQLAVELRRVREQGYALDRAEFLPIAECVGAPIYDCDGRVIAAVAITAPKGRLDQHLEEWAELAKHAAGAISTDLGQ